MLNPREESEFWTFYRKTAEAQSRKAYRMCGGQKADADDAHQETFLKALANWKLLSSLAERQRSAWLAKTLMREVLQIWRSNERRREAEGRAAASWPSPASDDTSDVGRILSAERYRTVCQAIASLSGRPRDVMALYGPGGYETHEIAEILGIRPQTVRVHLHEARRQLREILDGQEGSA